MLTRRINQMDGDIHVKIFTTLVLLILNLICVSVSHSDPTTPPPQYFVLIQNLASGSDGEDIHHVKELSKYAYKETVTALFNRLLFEVNRTKDTGDVHTELFVVLLKAIGKTATVADLPNLQEFAKQLDTIAIGIKDEETRKKEIDPIRLTLEKASGIIATRENDLPVALELMGDHHNLILPKAVQLEKASGESKFIIDKPVAQMTNKKPASVGVQDSPTKVSMPIADIDSSAPTPTVIALSTLTASAALPANQGWKKIFTNGYKKLEKVAQPFLQRMPFKRKQAVVVETEFTKEEKEKAEEAAKLLLEPIEVKKLSYEEVLQSLTNMRRFLEERIVGQPEVIDSLIAMERESLLLGNQTPVKRLFMGLSGSGATTIARAFTDAVNGRAGAYKIHMFDMPIINNRFEMNNIRGAPTGVIGSAHVSEFYKFVVQHSAGRYQLQMIGEGANEASRIVENPKWTPGMLIPGYYLPEQAVVNIEKFHLWIKQSKDLILLEGLKTGKFKVANPAGGVSELIVPMKFMISTHEGTALLASRELNGQRHGEPMTYEEMMNKWENEHQNPDRLKNEMRRSNGSVNATTDTSEMPGISENMLSSFGDGELLLLRPHSVEGLKKIVELKLEDMKEKFKESERLVGPLQITWSKELVEFLATYQHLAEENATPIESRVKNMVQDLILKAFEKMEIKPSEITQELHLNIQRNEDKTYSLLIEKTQRQVVRKNAEGHAISEPKDITTKIPLLIGSTLSEKDRTPITDDQIDSILALGQWMKTRVFNVDKIIDRLIGHYLTSVEKTRQKIKWHKATTPAQRYMFLGFSSTGKSEVTKVFAEAKYKKRSAIMQMDFGQIKTIEQLREKILGTRDRNNNPIPSDFMKEYDRNGGNLIVLLDEASNAPPEIFKMLHEIFRDPVVVFSDGVPRPMAGVTLIMTGNAGEEWMTSVPRDIPVEQQLAAMNAMFEAASNDPEARRALLEKYFHPALLNRVGENNIFFYGPLTFKAIRQLTQLKLGLALKELKPQVDKRGWNLYFESSEEYLKLVEMIEDIGFVLHEQGASIDRFVNEDLMSSIHLQLLKEKIPTNTPVQLKVTRLEDVLKENTKQKHYRVDILTEHKTLSVQLLGRSENVRPVEDKVSKFLTAVHEAAHELANKILFDDAYSPVQVSLIPGVTKRGGKWVYYDGIAQSKSEKHMRINRGLIIQMIASLAAGEVAETLVTKGGIHDAGKADDMERATSLARRAILQFGLSEKFGRITMAEGTSMAEQMSLLSASQKEVFASEVQAFLQEGRALAHNILVANMKNALLPLAAELAQRGEMMGEDVVEFYKKHDVNMNKVFPVESVKQDAVPSDYVFDPMNIELNEDITLPDHFADVTQIAINMKRKAVAEVAIPDDVPLGEDCESLLSTRTASH